MGGPGADTSTWTPPADIAAAVEMWCELQASREGGGGGAGETDAAAPSGSLLHPPSGSLLRVQTAGGRSSWVLS